MLSPNLYTPTKKFHLSHTTNMLKNPQLPPLKILLALLIRDDIRYHSIADSSGIRFPVPGLSCRFCTSAGINCSFVCVMGGWGGGGPIGVPLLDSTVGVAPPIIVSFFSILLYETKAISIYAADPSSASRYASTTSGALTTTSMVPTLVV